MQVRRTVISLVLLTCGCTGQRLVEQSSSQLLGQFSKQLGDLGTAVSAIESARPEGQPEMVDDLRHRVGKLEEVTAELHHQTRNNPAAQAAVLSITESLAEMRRIIESRPDEGVPNLADLRQQQYKLKSQVDELQAKL